MKKLFAQKDLKSLNINVNVKTNDRPEALMDFKTRSCYHKHTINNQPSLQEIQYLKLLKETFMKQVPDLF